MAFLDRTGPLDGPANGHCELSATLDSFPDDPGTTALVFPPTLNSYERLQIHTLVQNCYSHRLTSFSAGEENQRRILIVPKSALKPSSVTAAALDVPPVPKEAVCQTVPLTENLSTNKAGSKKKRLPSQALYRPRAARLAESAANTSEGQIRSKPLPHPAEALAPKNWKDEVQQKLGDAQIRWVECFSLPSSCGKPLDAAAPLDESSEFELNILEIYGFPVEYKTGDLTKELDPFKNKYELRWVDDTHAVAIFETEALAAKALSHPFPSIKVSTLICESFKILGYFNTFPSFFIHS